MTWLSDNPCTLFWPGALAGLVRGHSQDGRGPALPLDTGERNESIYIVGSPIKGVWREQQRLGTILKKVQRGPPEYKSEDDLPYDVGWNRRSPGSTERSFGGWATEELGVKLAACFEVPYATARGGNVTPETARALERDLARASVKYLLDVV